MTMTWMIRSAAWLSVLACAGLAAEVRAQQCRNDADCEQGAGCRKDDSASGCDVPPSLPGEDPKVPPECNVAPMEAEYGECEPLPIACEADADCPDGLACHKPDEDNGSCVYVPVECTSDRDCEAGDACTVLDGEQTCSATPGAPCTGGQCPPPPEPTCTRVERRHCFPRRVDCTTNADCGADRRCVALPEEIQEEAPEPWQGATRLCLEEGIALLVEGRIEAEGTVSHESSGMRLPNRANGEPGERPVEEDADRQAENTAQSDDDCAVAAPGASADGGTAWLVLCGLAFALGIARRRG